MHVMRPVRRDDMGALQGFSQASIGGITSLPKSEELIEGRVADSLASFAGKGPGAYLFALEDLSSGEVVGCSGVLARANYTLFQIGEDEASSERLELQRSLKTLSLERSGLHSEVGSLFLSSEHRVHGLGWLLTRPRYLFIAAFPHLFESRVIASLRGVIEDGYAPFWDQVSGRFFGMEFGEATLQRFIDDSFIDELAPRHPLYIDLLPEGIVGATHASTEAGMAMIAKEGFRQMPWVDIFDGGPFFSASVDEVEAVKGRQTVQVAEIGPTEGDELLISNDRLSFRSCLGAVGSEGTISHEVATALEVGVGDTISFVRSHP
jgi:arginine N-succinyltransferase